MMIRRLGTLFVPMFVGAAVFVPSAAVATNGAQFTSLSAEYVELDSVPDDGSTDDADGHEDDLIVSFTETGAGNAKAMDIYVSAVREITMTCISAYGSAVVIQSEVPFSVRFPGESSNAAATFTSDEDGNVSGTVPLHTSLHDEVCPTEGNDAGAFVIKDYAITYTDLTVIDNENGGASASIARVEEVPGEPGYEWEDLLMFGAEGNLAGFTCTVHDVESGNCHSS